MHVFIDESGSFTGYHGRSLSVVGALAIPDGKLEFIKRKYAKLRSRWPLENGEAKGRLLNEQQVNEVVTLLARNDALFEITAIDLSFHTESDIAAYKQQHAKGMLARVDGFQEPDRTLVEQACHQISATSLPLYVQAIMTFELLHSIVSHVPLYFAQRATAGVGVVHMDCRWQRTEEKNELGTVVVMVRSRRTLQYVEATPFAPIGRRGLLVL